MGLSPLLVDTYRQYKRDTEIFTQWLGTTARATGLVEGLFDKAAEKQHLSGSGRKKGRNRKPRNEASAHKVSVNAFITLTNALKDTTSSRIPRHMMTILEDILKARRGCAAWYRTHQTEASATKDSHNEGHQHIIEILQEVHRILVLLQEEDTTKVKEAARSSKAGPSTNLFDMLEIEECPDWEPDCSSMPAPTKKIPRVTYEPKATSEDVSFALYCFMKDLTDIRMFIRRTWREYKHGQTTLNSAAVTANTAIDVICRLNEAFVETFPQFAEHKSLIDYLYGGYVDPNSKGSNIIDDKDFASYSGDDVHLSSKTFFCDHTTYLTGDFYGSSLLPMYQRHLMAEKGITEEEHVILQCLSHFNVMDWQVNGPDVEHCSGEICFDDHVLRAVRTMRVEKKRPTWAIFACQVFIDTRRELGGQVSRGLEDLRNEGRWLKASWNQCLETGKDNQTNKFHEYNDVNIHQRIRELEQMVESDFIQDLMDDFFQQQPDKAPQYNWGPYFLLRNHPLMCGLILQDHLVYHHSLGTSIAADQGPVRTAIHLTHAASLAGAIPKLGAWADLDYIVKKHGDAYLFVGQRPTKLFDCHRRMSLAFGASASQFSMNKNLKLDCRILKQRRDPPSIQKLHRRLNPMARYVLASQTRDGNTLRPTRAAGDAVVMMESVVNGLILSKDISCPSNPFNAKTNQKPRQMTPLQSLAMFKQALKDDDLPLRFNLANLNWRCIQLLRCIQNICLEQSPLVYPRKQWGGDCNLNSFIGHMFAGVAGVPCDQPTRFREACALVGEVIAKEGNVEYLQAVAFRGIKLGTAVDVKDDPENFEDPVHNLVPRQFRKDLQHYSAEQLALFKSRAAYAVDLQRIGK